MSGNDGGRGAAVALRPRLPFGATAEDSFLATAVHQAITATEGRTRNAFGSADGCDTRSSYGGGLLAR